MLDFFIKNALLLIGNQLPLKFRTLFDLKISTKKPDTFASGFCSPSWARTKDPLINSQML